MPKNPRGTITAMGGSRETVNTTDVDEHIGAAIGELFLSGVQSDILLFNQESPRQHQTAYPRINWLNTMVSINPHLQRISFCWLLYFIPHYRYLNKLKKREFYLIYSLPYAHLSLKLHAYHTINHWYMNKWNQTCINGLILIFQMHLAPVRHPPLRARLDPQVIPTKSTEDMRDSSAYVINVFKNDWRSQRRKKVK